MDSAEASEVADLTTAADAAGWDPYHVWYTRVLLPRSRVTAIDLEPVSLPTRAPGGAAWSAGAVSATRGTG